VSSYYGVTFPEFWTGETGRALRREGGKPAQILGLYLTSNRSANMLGLYKLLSDDVTHETGLTPKELARAYAVTALVGFAEYDAASSFVWVRTMARFRVGLRPGQTLKPDDNRVRAANRLYQCLDPNPFLGRFFDCYCDVLRLQTRRVPEGVVVPYAFPSPSEGLRSPLQGPCKPVHRDQSTEIRDQGTEIRDQETEEETEEQERTISVEPREDGAVQPTPTRPAFDHFFRRFDDWYHAKPALHRQKDGARMKRLLREAGGLDAVERRIDAFFDPGADPFWAKCRHTFDVFFAAGTQTKLIAVLSGGGFTAVSPNTRQSLAARDRVIERLRQSGRLSS
jgi:hypothetical protein